MRRRTLLLLSAAGLPLSGCPWIVPVLEPFATAMSGDFAVVWQDNQDGRVKAKVYKAGATSELLPTFQVSPSGSNPQRVPSIATFLGGFVVVWVEWISWDIKAKGFNIDGSIRFDTVTVASNVQWDNPAPGDSTDDPWRSPRVAAARDGSFFVVCWTRNASQTSVARRFSASGVAGGPAFDIGPIGSMYADVAMADDGTFAVTYTGPAAKSFLRGFHQNGTIKFGSTPIELGDGTLLSNFGQSIAMSRDGARITVVQATWQDPTHLAPVHAHGFDGNGNNLFSTVPVPSGSPPVAVQARTFPTVAMYDDGKFFAVWSEDRDQNGTNNIRGRLFNADGSARGSDFIVNASTSGNQRVPAIATNRHGGFVVVWHDNRNGTDDVFGRGLLGTDDHAQYISEFMVNGATAGQQHFPRVAFIPT